MDLRSSVGGRTLSRRTSLLCAVSLAALVAGAGAASAQTITNLGVLPGSAGSQAAGVSANGRAAAGLSWGVNSFRWQSGKGLEDLGFLPDSSFTWAWAISGNGEAISGFAFLNSGLDRAFRWTRAHGVEDLGTLPNALYGAEATGISFSGDEVTGVSTTDTGDYHAFRWTPRRGMKDLGTLPGGGYSYGLGISGDGEVVTGFSGTPNGELAYRWTARRGMEALPTIAPGDYAGGYAVDEDGSTIAGYSGSNAALWRGGKVKDLGTLPGGSFSVAYALSSDGRVVGGLCDSGAGALVACLYTERLGMVDLNEHLAALGVDLTDWTLDSTTGLSEDGSTVVGTGTYRGETRAFLAHVRSIEGERGHPNGHRPCAHEHHNRPGVERQGRLPHRR